jgi:hypothetical protein
VKDGCGKIVASQSAFPQQKEIMIKKYIPRAFRGFSFLIAIGTLPQVGAICVAKSSDSRDDAGKGPSGTLTYRGVVSGGVTFPSADCTFDKHQHMVGFIAPHQDGGHPEIKSPGPVIAVGFFDPGALIEFTTSQQHPTDQTSFMRMKQKDGVSYAKKGDSWVVTITGMKIPNLDVMNQQWTTLSGTFVCTHLVNG